MIFGVGVTAAGGRVSIVQEATMAGRHEDRANLIIAGLIRASLAEGRAALDRGDLQQAEACLVRARETLLVLDPQGRGALAGASDALGLAIEVSIAPQRGSIRPCALVAAS